MYRILWKSYKTKKWYKSPFVFKLSKAKKLVKNMRKLCKDTIFTITEELNFLSSEEYSEKFCSYEDRKKRFLRIKKEKKDAKEKI